MHTIEPMRRFVPAVVGVLVMAAVVVAIVVVASSESDDGGGRQRGGPARGATTASTATTPSTTPPAATPPAATSSATTATPTTVATAFAPSGAPAMLLAAGDIASCTSQGDEATAALLDSRPSATVATLGDNVYPNGTRAEFERCYGPSWGRHRSRTRPAPGNHDYATPGASGYFGYFGAAAGDPRTGYYSYDLGAWHVVVLNSNCGPVGCGRGSAQERWLRADLEAHPRACTLAYFHHPRFSSGDQHGPSRAMGPLFEILYAGGVDLVLAGHDHTYERFAPLDPNGLVDTARGIRSFVVGTGGRSHYGFDEPLMGSEVREGDTYGVLALDLHDSAYRWSFLPVAGESFTDSGTGTCH